MGDFKAVAFSDDGMPGGPKLLVHGLLDHLGGGLRTTGRKKQQYRDEALHKYSMQSADSFTLNALNPSKPIPQPTHLLHFCRILTDQLILFQCHYMLIGLAGKHFQGGGMQFITFFFTCVKVNICRYVWTISKA